MNCENEEKWKIFGDRREIKDRRVERYERKGKEGGKKGRGGKVKKRYGNKYKGCIRKIYD